jgi:fructose-bisphosphate aldolase, class I
MVVSPQLNSTGPRNVARKPVTSQIAGMLLGPGKGILALDHDARTTDRVLAGAGIAPGADTRRGLWEFLITTPGLSRGLSAVVLGDEAIRARALSGRRLPDELIKHGLFVGVGLDAVTTPMSRGSREKTPEDPHGLPGRLADYRELGARFVRWRSRGSVGDDQPVWQVMRGRAQSAARCALACQQAGLVPLLDCAVALNAWHSLSDRQTVTSTALSMMVDALREIDVALDAVILGVTIVLPGRSCPAPATPQDVARATVGVLRDIVPAEIAGIALLGGRRASAAAIADLAATQLITAPWPMTFLFGRTLFSPAVTAWRADPAKVRVGQRELSNRVECAAAVLRSGYAEQGAPRHGVPWS